MDSDMIDGRNNEKSFKHKVKNKAPIVETVSAYSIGGNKQVKKADTKSAQRGFMHILLIGLIFVISIVVAIRSYYSISDGNNTGYNMIMFSVIQMVNIISIYLAWKRFSGCGLFSALSTNIILIALYEMLIYSSTPKSNSMSTDNILTHSGIITMMLFYIIYYSI